MKTLVSHPLRALPVLVAVCLLQVCLTQPIAGKGAYPVKWLGGYDLYQSVKGGGETPFPGGFPAPTGRPMGRGLQTSKGGPKR